MIANHSTSGFQKSIAIAFGLMFVLLALVLSYAAFSGKSDIRSKAAEEGVIYKQWGFSGNSTENWNANGTSIMPNQGMLQLNSTANGVSIENSQISIDLPSGVKKISYRLRLYNEDELRPYRGKGPYTIEVSYQIKGKTEYERPITVSGIFDYEWHEYSVTLPNPEAFTIEKMKISFIAGYSQRLLSYFDWIRISGALPISQVIPTISQQTTWPPKVSPHATPTCSPDKNVCQYDVDTEKLACNTYTTSAGTMYCPHLAKPLICRTDVYEIPSDIDLVSLDLNGLSKSRISDGAAIIRTAPGKRFLMNIVVSNALSVLQQSDLYAAFIKYEEFDPYVVKTMSSLCSGPHQTGTYQSWICQKPQLSVSAVGDVQSNMYTVIEMTPTQNREIQKGKKFTMSANAFFDGIKLNCGGQSFTYYKN